MMFCLAPIARIAGLSRRTYDERMIENGPRSGAMMPVEVDTHCVSLIEFKSEVIGQMRTSLDVWDSETPRFEIFGEDSTICIADPDPDPDPDPDDAARFAEVIKFWPSAFSVGKEERLRGVSHYMSPKVWVGNLGLTMFHSGLVPLNVGLHRAHAFCPVRGFLGVHTQIVGLGKMQ